MLKVEIGAYAGFCRGVKHAVNGAFACARESQEEIFTEGELIHNPQTLQLLAQHGVHILPAGADPAGIRDKTVIIRAHGVGPGRLKELETTARAVRNFTCRDVARVQGIIKQHSKKGHPAVIFGKRDHPEVEGLLGFACQGYVVFTDEDVAALPELEQPVVVSQTTMEPEAFDRICSLICDRFPRAEVVNTICSATELRQNEVRELAARNDRILVIGASHSSNTKRLYEIASDLTTAHLITRVEDLSRLDLRGSRRVGVTAGASTPDWLIEEVVEELRRSSQPRIVRALKSVALFSLYSSVFDAVGAALLSFAVADLIGVPFAPLLALLVALYYLSMSLLNTYTNRASMKIDNPRRYTFILRRRAPLTALFLVTVAALALLAVRLGPLILLVTLFSLALGVAYNLAYLPLKRPNERVLFFRKRDLPALKSLVISLAVTVLLIGLPLLYHFPSIASDLLSGHRILGGLGLYFSAYFVFLLVLTRQALLEIKTAQTDRIAGVHSLLNLIPVSYIKAALIILPTVLLVLMGLGVLLGHFPPAKTKYFIAVGYSYVLVLLAGSRTMLRSRLVFELVVGLNPWVAGLLALL